MSHVQLYTYKERPKNLLDYFLRADVRWVCDCLPDGAVSQFFAKLFHVELFQTRQRRHALCNNIL